AGARPHLRSVRRDGISRHGHDRPRPRPRSDQGRQDARPGARRSAGARLHAPVWFRFGAVDHSQFHRCGLSESREGEGVKRGRLSVAILLAGAALLAPARLNGQQRGAPPAPPTPKASAPIDLTGYWVSFVNEDWRYRMVTPAKGDFKGVPITL